MTEEKNCPTCGQAIGKVGLSKGQSEMLGIIKTFIHAHGHSPSFDELAAIRETTKSNVSRYVTALARRGYIKYQPFHPRSIVVL